LGLARPSHTDHPSQTRSFNLHRPPAGPAGEDAAADGDAAHRGQLTALFLASYVTDMLQLSRRPQEFTQNFTAFMNVHHLLSLSWFTPWMVLFAPRGAEGAPIWNTVRRSRL
jgi:hypothetical protein